MHEISNVSHLKVVVGEKHISWRTSGRRLAVRSRASLCHMMMSPLFWHVRAFSVVKVAPHIFWVGPQVSNCNRGKSSAL